MSGALCVSVTCCLANTAGPPPGARWAIGNIFIAWQTWMETDSL